MQHLYGVRALHLLFVNMHDNIKPYIKYHTKNAYVVKESGYGGLELFVITIDHYIVNRHSGDENIQ